MDDTELRDKISGFGVSLGTDPAQDYSPPSTPRFPDISLYALLQQNITSPQELGKTRKVCLIITLNLSQL